MDWIFTALPWYLVLFLLGLVFFPLTRKFFGFFFDQGYAFAKTIAILLVSYAMFLLGSARLIPFSQTTLIALIAIFALGFGWLFRKELKEILRLPRSTLIILIFEELLFLAAFLFLVYVRSQEPSIRGLEKFMDFGFMQSILRSKYFPPLDMWYAGDPTRPVGYPINYYYFGHLTGAFLIKLTGANPFFAYNFILATIFAQAITMVFSLVATIVSAYKKTNVYLAAFYGLLGSFIVNLGGNLHTIYLFTKGYPNEEPIPFWQIFSTYTPEKYWYPNATRFIPFTIHEFPSYSYVVADLHGHVFDIPFVLLTLAIIFLIVYKGWQWWGEKGKLVKEPALRQVYPVAILLGFMTAIHYMTNAFDGPIYFLLIVFVFWLIFGWGKRFLLASIVTVLSFVVFSLPFLLNFESFVKGIGVNCSAPALVKMQQLGPFIFEANKCQISPLWMLFVLWGFFWISFVLFTLAKFLGAKIVSKLKVASQIDVFILALFALGIFLVTIPEFFYAKDIYPAHFRANTMFKLGYQAFIMMGIASTFTLFRISLLKGWVKYALKAIFLFFLFFVILYPFYSFQSFYGKLDKQPQLDGAYWLKTELPQDREIIDYLNNNVFGQPNILEAQGDSYTDFDRVSAYTGLPTVAGWWVHEWLWRDSAGAVGLRIPDIEKIYQDDDLKLTKELLAKYKVSYVIVSDMEREKYKKLNEAKFTQIGKMVFRSKNGKGAVYEIAY